MKKGEGNPRNFSRWSPVLPGSLRVFAGSCLGLSVARIESEDAAGSFLRFPGQGKGQVVTKS